MNDHIMPPNRRLFLLAATVIAGGCKGLDEPVSQQEVQRLIDQFQAIRPSGRYAVRFERVPLADMDVWSWRPALQTGAPVVEDLPSDYLDRLSRRFGPAIAEALTEAQGHAGLGAPVAPEAFPIVVFQPGASFGARDYRLMLEDMASHGVIILAMNPLASPRGSEARYGDVADEFHRLLGALPGAAGIPERSLSRVILMGHSLGGAGAVLALDHALANAAVNIDGDWLPTTPPAPNKPILYLTGQNPGEPASAEARRARVWSEVRRDADNAVALRLPDMRHLDALDGAALWEDPRRPRNAALLHLQAMQATLSQWILTAPQGDQWLPASPTTVLKPAFVPDAN